MRFLLHYSTKRNIYLVWVSSPCARLNIKSPQLVGLVSFSPLPFLLVVIAPALGVGIAF